MFQKLIFWLLCRLANPIIDFQYRFALLWFSLLLVRGLREPYIQRTFEIGG